MPNAEADLKALLENPVLIYGAGCSIGRNTFIHIYIFYKCKIINYNKKAS